MEITGRLTADAKVSTVNGDRQVVHFSIAVNDHYKTKDGERKQLTTYFNCSYWITAKIAKNLKKGAIVLLYGRIGVSAWTNMNGDAQASLNFHVNNIHFVGGGKSNVAAISEETGNTEPAPENVDDLPF